MSAPCGRTKSSRQWSLVAWMAHYSCPRWVYLRRRDVARSRHPLYKKKNVADVLLLHFSFRVLKKRHADYVKVFNVRQKKWNQSPLQHEQFHTQPRLSSLESRYNLQPPPARPRRWAHSPATSFIILTCWEFTLLVQARKFKMWSLAG